MTEIVYKGFRKDELEYQYNPRESVTEYPQLSKRKAEQARKVRETAKSWLNVSYGSSPRETMDIYAANMATMAGASCSSRRATAASFTDRCSMARATRLADLLRAA